MIPPEDLKNKSFSRTVRGYNPIEVDDYILFLLTKYEQLYAENAELEKRLHIVSGKYEELASDEDSIRKAVGQAQKFSESMIRSAERSAAEILERVNTRCEDMIQDAQIKVESEQIKLAQLRLDAAKFKEMLIEEYSKYLKLLRATEIPSPEDAKKEFPSGALIFDTAMDEIEPAEILETSVLAAAADPEL
ncbi:MAG: DivIVA domain-containing protein, partial [Clostridia bacterium]|nr:DivIVA domain-containing protein [Clostridia bacterium]